jgi:hypothetical protein
MTPALMFGALSNEFQLLKRPGESLKIYTQGYNPDLKAVRVSAELLPEDQIEAVFSSQQGDVFVRTQQTKQGFAITYPPERNTPQTLKKLSAIAKDEFTLDMKELQEHCQAFFKTMAGHMEKLGTDKITVTAV